MKEDLSWPRPTRFCKRDCKSCTRRDRPNEATKDTHPKDMQWQDLVACATIGMMVLRVGRKGLPGQVAAYYMSVHQFTKRRLLWPVVISWWMCRISGVKCWWKIREELEHCENDLGHLTLQLALASMQPNQVMARCAKAAMDQLQAKPGEEDEGR